MVLNKYKYKKKLQIWIYLKKNFIKKFWLLDNIYKIQFKLKKMSNTNILID